MKYGLMLGGPFDGERRVLDDRWKQKYVCARNGSFLPFSSLEDVPMEIKNCLYTAVWDLGELTLYLYEELLHGLEPVSLTALKQLAEGYRNPKLLQES